MRRLFAVALAVQVGVALVALAWPRCCAGEALVPAAGLAGYLALAGLARWRPDSMLLGLGVYSAAGVHAALAVVMARGAWCVPCLVAVAGAAALVVGLIGGYPRVAMRAAWGVPIFAVPALAMAGSARAPVLDESARWVGPPEAEVEAVVWVSPTCGACRRFDARILPGLQARARVLRRYAIEPFDLHGREEAIRELHTRFPSAPREALVALVERDAAEANRAGLRELPTVELYRDGRSVRWEGIPSSVEALWRILP